jgi:hypothetical protein
MDATERQMHRILLMDFILRVSDGRNPCMLPGDGISSKLYSSALQNVYTGRHQNGI